LVKILCIADEVDPLVYSQNIRERYGDVDFVIGAGDLRLKYYGFIVSSINKPLYFVFGNHQLQHLKSFSKKRNSYVVEDGYTFQTRNYFGSTYIGERVVRDRKTGLILTGFGGCRRYNNGENQFSERAMMMKILGRIPKMLYYKVRYGRWVDIVVTHAPPFGIHDKEDLCHRGFTALLWFMRIFKPRYLIHGHVHLLDMNDRRVDTYHETEVINAYSSYLLTVEEEYE